MFSLKLYLCVFTSYSFGSHSQSLSNKLITISQSPACKQRKIQFRSFLICPHLDNSGLLGLHSHAAHSPELDMLQTNPIWALSVSCLFCHRTQSQIPVSENHHAFPEYTSEMQLSTVRLLLYQYQQCRTEPEDSVHHNKSGFCASNFNPNFLRQSFIHSTYCLFCGFHFLMVTERECSGNPNLLMFGRFQNSARCSRGLGL